MEYIHLACFLPSVCAERVDHGGLKASGWCVALATYTSSVADVLEKVVDGGPWLISPPSCQMPDPVPRPHRVVSSTGDRQRSDQPVCYPTGSVLSDPWTGK